MTTRRAWYEPDHDSFGRFILSDQMRDVTKAAAKDIRDIATATAPRSKGPGPHMADQYEVSTSGVIVIGGNPRVMCEVVNPDRAAAPNEFGTKNNKRRRTLGRAGALIGEFKGDL